MNPAASEPPPQSHATTVALSPPFLSHPRLLKRSLSWSSLLCMVYVTVCAGPFGLEDLVTTVGPGMTFLLLAITPILWGLPLLFMSAELSSALPLEGGLYRWVKFAFGDFWGFQAGWWWWLSSFLDCAIYAVLVADYFRFFHPEMSKLAHWGVALTVIWFFTFLNVRGIQVIGTSSVLFVLFMMAPFVIMLVLGVRQMEYNPFVPFVPHGQNAGELLSSGLLISIWFISGFEGLATASEEIHHSERVIAKALVIVFPLVLASYGLPILVSLAIDPNWSYWQSGHFTHVAQMVGGPWLGTWVSMAGVIANMALFGTWLLSYSRIPFAMASDGFLPKSIAHVSDKHGTPITAILLSGVIYSIFAWSDFKSLVIIDIWVILGGIFLEFLALLKLRFSHPNLPRHFRVPGGKLGLMFTVISPIGVGLFAMFSSGSEYIVPGLIAVATGPVAFWVCRRLVKTREVEGR